MWYYLPCPACFIADKYIYSLMDLNYLCGNAFAQIYIVLTKLTNITSIFRIEELQQFILQYHALCELHGLYECAKFQKHSI